MVLVSSPGKVILFGEHAVVYGFPALASAIDRRIYVKAEKNSLEKIVIASKGKKTSFSFKSLKRRRGEFRYILRALKIAFDTLGMDFGISIEIDSKIPRASGLGSSAAISVAVLKAAYYIAGEDIKNGKLAVLGHRVELEVQGSASPTDTATSALGGVLFIHPGKAIEKVEIRQDVSLIVGCTGMKRSTKELVAKVKTFKETYPNIAEPIIASIGEITIEARTALGNGDYQKLGKLMLVNNALLDALGVGNMALSRRVYSAIKAGAAGAKLTGAGGGGCMIALARENREMVLKALGKRAFVTKISKEGTRVEHL
ncbi:mevalonate kinase [archaeon]|nr:mevalonate kinase [archaeon]